MTRLQKKCLFAAAGAHLLVLVVLFCAGFIPSSTKVDNTVTLDVIPSTLVDALLSSGVPNPTPPPPVVKPVDPTPPEPTPLAPEPPKVVVTPTPPQVKPEPVKPPEDLKPVDNPEIKIQPPKQTKPKIKVDLTPVTRDQKKVADDTAKADAAAKEKARQDELKRAKAFKTAMNNIKNNTSAPTEVKMVGTSSVSYANYAAAVKKAYDDAWSPPDDMSSDDVTTKVSVTIGRDGRVISSRIISASGESRVDASVQRALDRVDYIAPFPDGATETQRTFIINFNPQAKRLNG